MFYNILSLLKAFPIEIKYLFFFKSAIKQYRANKNKVIILNIS